MRQEAVCEQCIYANLKSSTQNNFITVTQFFFFFFKANRSKIILSLYCCGAAQ